MAVKSKEEILDSMKALLGENDSDDTLEFIGDVSDTLDSFSSSAEEIAKLKKEKEDLDKSWRAKYRDRFYGKVDVEEVEEEEEHKPRRFEDLFKEE